MNETVHLTCTFNDVVSYIERNWINSHTCSWFAQIYGTNLFWADPSIRIFKEMARITTIIYTYIRKDISISCISVTFMWKISMCAHKYEVWSFRWKVDACLRSLSGSMYKEKQVLNCSPYMEHRLLLWNGSCFYIEKHELHRQGYGHNSSNTVFNSVFFSCLYMYSSDKCLSFIHIFWVSSPFLELKLGNYKHHAQCTTTLAILHIVYSRQLRGI